MRKQCWKLQSMCVSCRPPENCQAQAEGAEHPTHLCCTEQSALLHYCPHSLQSIPRSVLPG